MKSQYHCLPMLTVLLSLLLIACDTVDPGDPVFERRELPRELTEAESALVRHSSDFSFRFFREAWEHDSGTNLFVSPLSISMAFAMAMNGAEGETQEQMIETLGYGGMDREQINSSYSGLIELLESLDPKVRFSIANSAWYRDTFPVEPEFLNRIEAAYRAHIESSDFDDPATVGRINDWVSDATQGLINEVIEGIDPETILFLINAIYFNGDWTWSFDRDRTAPAPFTREDGEVVQVPMMRMEEAMDLSFHQTERARLVDLPYGDAGFVMTLILPDEGTELDEVITGLDGEAWRELTGDMTSRKVDLVLPSFEVSYSVPGLPDVMESLGMINAFDPSLSDFSAINRDRGRDIYISDASHKTFISVDEAGTEAAAVTTIEVGIVSVPVVEQMIFDRPFLYLIREVESGAILFMGTVTDPL